MKLSNFGLLALTLLVPACYDFHVVGPEDPPALKSPATVSVNVSYQRPVGCVNTASSCTGPVTFHASWMKLGSSLTLTQTAEHVWTATIPNVPVNYPGVDPYRVYAVDQYLLDSPTQGVSADRLTVGGQRITKLENPGGTREQGLIFIDANGLGRSPQQ
jgi:hypothetical protein